MKAFGDAPPAKSALESGRRVEVVVERTPRLP